jgi:hypothetical protein
MAGVTLCESDWINYSRAEEMLRTGEARDITRACRMLKWRYERFYICRKKLRDEEQENMGVIKDE